jgi:hypothetical protein
MMWGMGLFGLLAAVVLLLASRRFGKICVF